MGRYDSPTDSVPGHGPPSEAPPAQVDPISAPPEYVAAGDGTAPTATPSQIWTSSGRPELSAEHVALLKWWADMIAAGQFPGAPAGHSAQDEAARDEAPQDVTAGAVEGADPGRRRRRAVALGIGAVVLAGLAAVTAPRFLGGDQTPSSEAIGASTTMPAAVGDLVPVTDPQVGDSMQPLLGLGLRPTGVTVTGAYGADPGGPLELAAMATSTTTAADAAAQIEAWTARTGATVGEPATGSGRAEGITCAPVKKAKGTAAGAFCVWTAGALRGQSYAIGAEAAAAQELTADLRAAISPDSAGSDLVADS
ncbi:MAG: hypothetical protein WCF36_21245 [Candidatus Nanopelagicales bacterium]